MVSTWGRIQACILFLFLLVGALRAPAATNYHALIIRSLHPLDSVLVEKFKVNNKQRFYRLIRDAPLTKYQYKRLPKLSFAEVDFFRVATGRLRVYTASREEFLALPENFKNWPAGRLEPAAIIRGSRLRGRLLHPKRFFQAALAEGWIVYLFPRRPGEDTVAFSLAEAQKSEEAWVNFLQRFPRSRHARGARQRLAGLYLERVNQALNRFQDALQERKPGYGSLGEARRWFDRLSTLDVETPGVAEAETALTRFETDIAQRLGTARELADKGEFSPALQTLEPLRHFRDQFPELATTLEDIERRGARYHLDQARQRLARAEFDAAVRELDQAATYQQRPEIPVLRKEIERQRVAYQRQQQIQQAVGRAREAMAQENYATAFDSLLPVAQRYPDEAKLQQEFSSLQRIYRQALLAAVAQSENLHAPIRGPADEESLLKLHKELTRLSQFDSSPTLAVWRDRLSLYLADYYRQRATEIAKRKAEAPRALALAYLQQAQHFMLDKTKLTELPTWRERLEDRLRIRVALNFRDLTPAGSGEYLVAELSALIASAIQNAGFPHVDIVEVRRGERPRLTLEFIVELLQATVHDDGQTQPVASEYSAGFRQVPNPAWREAKAAHDRARENYEQVRTRVQQNRRRKDYGKKQRQADEAALARAEAALKEAGEALDAVQAFIEQEDVRPYEFTRRTRVRTAETHLSYRWVNALKGVREVQEILEEKVPARGVEVTGVHPADKQGYRNQPANLPDAATLRGRVLRKVQQRLAERALNYLESFIRRDFAQAQLQAQRGNNENAAEYYLRFLFNSAPDDPRRLQAIEYLQREFRLSALGDWLTVSGGGY